MYEMPLTRKNKRPETMTSTTLLKETEQKQTGFGKKRKSDKPDKPLKSMSTILAVVAVVVTLEIPIVKR